MSLPSGAIWVATCEECGVRVVRVMRVTRFFCTGCKCWTDFVQDHGSEKVVR